MIAGCYLNMKNEIEIDDVIKEIKIILCDFFQGSRKSLVRLYFYVCFK